MARRPTTQTRSDRQTVGPTAEIGVAGLVEYSGYVQEEFISRLQGPQGVKAFRQMADNDATVGAVLAAIELLIMAVEWDIEPADDTPAAAAEAEFAMSLLDDMSHSFGDLVSEILSMLTYGWSYHEIVLKRRVGPDQNDPTRRSRFTDGRFGIRKLAPRAQSSLLRWQFQDDGGVAGMWQQPPSGGGTVFLPIERSLLFRTRSRLNNPEGRSILRNAYRAWHRLVTIEDYEAIGVERNLAGLPVVYIPAKYLGSDATAADKAILAQYTKLARDVRKNEQGGAVLPSDTFKNPDGSLSNVPLVKFELVKGEGGNTAVDTDKIIQRYQQTIARSVLADFLMLGGGAGGGRGSYSMSESKIDLFLDAGDAILRQIKDPLNRFLLPRIWAYNGLDPDLMPEYKPKPLKTVGLDVLGRFVADMAAAGAPIFPDEETENYLRSEAGIPPKSQEAVSGIPVPPVGKAPFAPRLPAGG